MTPTIRGLHATQAVVTQPIQWELLLLLAQQPQTSRHLVRQFTLSRYGRCWWGLWQLHRHQLVMFHVKHSIVFLFKQLHQIREVVLPVELDL